MVMRDQQAVDLGHIFDLVDAGAVKGLIHERKGSGVVAEYGVYQDSFPPSWMK